MISIFQKHERVGRIGPKVFYSALCRFLTRLQKKTRWSAGFDWVIKRRDLILTLRFSGCGLNLKLSRDIRDHEFVDVEINGGSGFLDSETWCVQLSA